MRKIKKYKYIKPALILIVLTLLIGGLSWYKYTRLSTPNLPEPPLKDLAAKHNIMLGNHAISNRLEEKPYHDILTQQFNLALLDNTPNWSFTDYELRPSEKEFDFSRLDYLVNYAQQNNMKMEAHHFLWGEQKWLPKWLKEGNYSHEQLNEIMRIHIESVGSRYSGKVHSWTVVNEPFTRKQHLFDLNDWWADNTGGLEYIDKAFLWARSADPNAKLILNDFNNESINDTSNMMYEYVKSAKARGIPIDVVGMQMHIDGSHPPTKDEVVSNMNRFADLGVEVYVTELDVNMNDLNISAEAKNEIQGRIYYDMMRACIEAKSCPSFSILGITDKETWYNHIGLKDPRPLPFDRRYQPKPAYWGLRAALEQK